jgi:glycyl-tRNA synthetase beta chain
MSKTDTSKTDKPTTGKRTTDKRTTDKRTTDKRTTAEFLLEVGCEELPAGFIDPALSWLAAELPAALAEHRIAHGAVTVEGTPRRLVVIVDDVAVTQADLEQVLQGPAWSVAYTAEGALTPAGEGWLKKNDVDVAAVFRSDGKKGPVIAARKHEPGRPTSTVLPGIVEALLPKIPFRKTMRWGDRHVTHGAVFGRPVQWLLALFDDRPLSVRFADVVSGSTTRGHRFHAPHEVTVTSVSSYFAALDDGEVVLSRKARAERIVAEANRLAASVGGKLVDDPTLVELVKNLVEKPFPLLGRFDAKFLAVPKELLISEAREHQKYFMVVDDKTGRDLLPAFVVVAGSDAADKAALAAGNARVLRARFEDGAFYFRTDSERTLYSRVADLDKLVFHKELGHYGEKARRQHDVAVALVEALARGLSAAGVDVARVRAEAARAALLCKADLTSGVVNEFPELQGVMGRYYAHKDGEPDGVARGIEEHYAPRHAGAALPDTDVGAVTGLADRFDTLTGILGIGKAPTGSADPFALRRAAIAVLTIALDRNYRFALADIAGVAVDAYQRQGRLTGVDRARLVAQVVDFVTGRLRGVLVEKAASVGFADAGDVVDASIAARGGLSDLPDVWDRLRAVARLRAGDPTGFSAVAAAFKRVGNIVKKARDDGHAVGGALPSAEELEHPAERALLEQVRGLGAAASHDATLEQVVAIRPAVDAFFNDVMVMVDDVRLRSARLALLGAIEARLSNVADFTRLQG